jgi:dTDP-4-amino-4,6-dideoxygalactose transaminase
MDEVRAICAEHGVPVIEDACQATGGALRGRVLGSIGDIGVLSFGGSKLMTAGRGGAVLTSDATLAQRIRLHTQRGNDAYPLSEMQAAVLLPQLKQLADRNAARQRNVNYILENWPVGAPLQPALFPESRSATDNRPAFYKVAFRYEPPPDGLSRESYSEAMRRRGVALDPGFAALHKIHSQRRFRAVGDLPNATALHESLMTLHHPVLLQSEGEIRRLIDAMCLP